MAKNYPQRVRQNILPLSIAGTLPEAFKEWFFTEDVHDHETPDAECQLCNKEELRYHFQIRNEHTEHELWVGSQCILKFKLSVYEDGKLLDENATKKKLDALTRKMQLQSCIKALEKLAIAENNVILKNALSFYEINKCLTPKYAFVVFWRLDHNKISYHPSFFKINLKKNKYKVDLREMSTDRVHFFWNALTSAQRRMANEMGHKSPEPR